ncbi:MAG TPA: HEAT repeat domain-containing protein, partial [Anditalea sp.]|nr:HEAT repeat domain-containing protein [Anditalea sp.]
MLKKSLFLTIIFLHLSFLGFAQRTDDQRTLTTKIVDLLAVMPSKDQKQLEENMEEMSRLGVEGLTELANMLSAPGSGDNTTLEYALAGYSFYVTDNNREELRAEAVKAYCQSLGNAQNPDVKAFLISQLQMVGKEDAIYCLTPYLGDERLCDAAARSLASINTTSAGETLRSALKESNGICKESILAALGDIKYKGALQDITDYGTNASIKLRKIALYALANMADPSSEKLLNEAANNASYTYSKDNATGAYIFFIQRLNESGHSDKATKLAKNLIKIAGRKG